MDNMQNSLALAREKVQKGQPLTSQERALLVGSLIKRNATQAPASTTIGIRGDAGDLISPLPRSMDPTLNSMV